MIMNRKILGVAFTHYDREGVAHYRVKTDAAILTATREIMAKNEIPIPLTPEFDVWQKMVGAHRRCGYCWYPLAGTNQYLAEHIATFHPEAKSCLPF